VAAGITDQKMSRKTRLGLLRDLRDALETGSEVSQVLRSEIAHYFGSLWNAKIALKTDPKLLSGWSKRKIVNYPSPEAPLQRETGLRNWTA
jgi:hypothetical protein